MCGCVLSGATGRAEGTCKSDAADGERTRQASMAPTRRFQSNQSAPRRSPEKTLSFALEEQQSLRQTTLSASR